MNNGQAIIIDEAIRSEHWLLDDQDECYFIRNFKSGTGYKGGEVNQTVFNFKKELKDREEPFWTKYKNQGILQVSDEITTCFSGLIDFKNSTLIPIPPSNRKDHEHFDDRMLQVLTRSFGTVNGCHISPLLDIRENTTPAHKIPLGGKRPTYKDRFDNLIMDENHTGGLRDTIILFDDVLTTGTHYKACKDKILERWPHKTVKGFFYSRADRTIKDHGLYSL